MLILAYLVVLAAGLGLPALAAMQGTSMWWLALIVNILATIVLIIAAFLLMAILAKRMFPEYWWMAQVQHEDIYQYDGVYFIGVRQSRQKSRLQKIIFGVDEKTRKWDMLFGLVLLMISVPHLIGGYSMHDVYGGIFRPSLTLPQSMHASTFSSLPVMKELNLRWNAGAVVDGKIQKALESAKAKGGKSNQDGFRLAQLHLLASFKPRARHQDQYQLTPGEAVFFNRGAAAQSVRYAERILAQPEMERGAWSRGALALTGLFHLSDRAYGKAQEAFDKALNVPGDGENSGLPRYQIVLLAAQSAMLSGDTTRAETLLESLLVDERLPRPAYPLAVEHFAGALHLAGRAERAAEMLEKSRGLYESQDNQAGLARIHLRRAAMAIQREEFKSASRSLSAASAIASGLEDGFTLNMVDWLSQNFQGAN